MPSGSIQAIPLDYLAFREKSYVPKVSMPSGSIQAIPRAMGPRFPGFDEFQCHLVRFKLFRSRTGLCLILAPTRVSMPSGSIQAIPLPNRYLFIASRTSVSMPSGSIQAIPRQR